MKPAAPNWGGAAGLSEWVEVLRAPVDQDLAALCDHMRGHGIPTWVFERNGEQCLCVPSGTDPDRLQEIFLLWQAGDGIDSDPDAGAPGTGQTVFADWHRFRLTLLLLLVSIASFLMVATPWGQANGGLLWLAALTLQPLTIEANDVQMLAQLPPLVQAWRFWTPVFLHFSVLHILFNGLIMLELGRRIEMVQGSGRLLWLVLVCGLISNMSQFLASPATLFGGLSGIVYALIGYGWLYQRLRGYGSLLVAPGLMAMALFWQALCFSGLVTLAGMGNIANAAHIGGMLAGLLCAWVAIRVDGAGTGKGSVAGSTIEA